MSPTPLSIQVDSVTKARWKRDAAQAGLSVSEWIRRRVDGIAVSAPAAPRALLDLAGPARPDPRPSSKK